YHPDNTRAQHPKHKPCTPVTPRPAAPGCAAKTALHLGLYSSGIKPQVESSEPGAGRPPRIASPGRGGRPRPFTPGCAAKTPLHLGLSSFGIKPQVESSEPGVKRLVGRRCARPTLRVINRPLHILSSFA